MMEPDIKPSQNRAGFVGTTIGAITAPIRENEHSPGNRLPSENVTDLAKAITHGKPEVPSEIMALHFDASTRALRAAGIS